MEAAATERSRRTRRALAEAAHACVAAKGRVDPVRIAEAAGVSVATFYSHFASHDDALAAAFDHALERVVGISVERLTIENLLERGVDGTVALLVPALVASFRAEGLVMRAALARLPQHRGLREIFRRHEAAALEHLERQISLGQKAGVVRNGSAARLAQALLVITQGLNNPLLLSKGRGSTALLGDLQRAVAEVLLPER